MDNNFGIIKSGTVTINPDKSIVVDGFSFDSMKTLSCAPEAVIRYSIDLLQQELMRYSSQTTKIN